jgi:uncharacterized protein YkwD
MIPPRWLTVAVTGALVTGLAVLWHEGESEATAQITAVDVEVASWVNSERRWNGVAPIPIDGDLSAQAALQAERLAACRCLFHSPQGEMGWWLQRGWTSVGETVGGTSGTGIEGLFNTHLAFIASPGHRAILLDPRYRGIGTAVRTSPDGRQWIVHFLAGF